MTAPSELRPGDRLAITAGPMVAGGACLCRIEDERPERGAVVLVRHAIPGERVVAVVTQTRNAGRLFLADTVEVLAPDPDRVEPPCRYAGPGGCGGCDLQHVGVPRQRELKGGILSDALRRIAKVEPATVGFDGSVRGVGPAPDDGLRWRTRSRFWALGGGLAMRGYHSHDLVAVDDCLIAEEAVVSEAAALAQALPDAVAVPGPREEAVMVAVGRTWTLAGDGFWQVHRHAADALAAAVLEAAGVTEDDRVWDLYSGVGLFAGAIAQSCGARVLAVEGDRRAVHHAQGNLADLPTVTTVGSDVGRWLAKRRASPHVIVLDPPRSGAGRQIMGRLTGSGARRMVYVACDPAALARDIGYAAERGWRVGGITAFDIFPMTHHLECVAVLEPVR